MTELEDCCEHAPITGHHLWMVYMHDADWETVRVLCSRCARRRTMLMEEVERYDRERDAKWREAAEKIRAQNLDSLRQRIHLLEERNH